MGGETEAAAGWNKYVLQLERLLAQCQATDKTGSTVDMDKALQAWVSAALQCRASDAEIMLVGNGASASMASHYAADIMKNAGIRTRLFTDVSMVTAAGNDLGYEFVFSYFIERFAGRNNLLVAISSSGNSPNILRAAEAARAKGANVITLSAFSPGNALRQLGDWNFYIQTGSYGFAESAHAAILHFWMDKLVANGHG